MFYTDRAWEIFTESYVQNVPLDEAFLKFRGDVRAGQATSGNTGDSLPDVDFAALKKEYDALDSISGRASEIEWVEFIQQYYSDACAMFDAGKGDMNDVGELVEEGGLTVEAMAEAKAEAEEKAASAT